MTLRSLLLTLQVVFSLSGVAGEAPTLASYARDFFTAFPPTLSAEEAKAKWEKEWNGHCRKLVSAPATSCHLAKFPVRDVLSATLYAETSGKFWNVQLVLRPRALAHDDVAKFLTSLPGAEHATVARQSLGKENAPEELRVRLAWGGYFATSYRATGISLLARNVGKATYRASSLAARDGEAPAPKGN